MKSKYILAVKFFTETKNEEQLDLSYKEIERFLDTYNEFIWYYSFTTNFNEDFIKEIGKELM